jgi:hypothetical protein
MGVERAVTVWYIHRQNILHEIEQLERKLAPALVVEAEAEDEAASEPELTPVSEEELAVQLVQARNRLRDLGPCPRPMMG